MRQACLWICMCLVCACADDDSARPESSVNPSAGSTKSMVDAGTKTAVNTLRPELPRSPGALKGGLPAELRPPR
jgi:hypothetical protein